MNASNATRIFEVSDDSGMEWPSAVLIILGTLTAVVSGLLVIVTARLRHKSLIYLLILNHNLADLIASVLLNLQVGLYIGNRLGKLSCVVFTLTRLIAFYESFMSLLLVSIERWIQASGYVDYRRVVTKRFVAAAIALTWLLGGCYVLSITVPVISTNSRSDFNSSVYSTFICPILNLHADDAVTDKPNMTFAPIMPVVLAITFTSFQTSAIRHLRCRYIKTKEAIEKGQTGYGIHPFDTDLIEYDSSRVNNTFVTVEERGIKCLQSMLRTSKAMESIIVVFDVLIISQRIVYFIIMFGSPRLQDVLKDIDNLLQLGTILNSFLNGIFYISFMSGIRREIVNLVRRRKNVVGPVRDISLSRSRVATIGLWWQFPFSPARRRWHVSVSIVSALGGRNWTFSTSSRST